MDMEQMMRLTQNMKKINDNDEPNNKISAEEAKRLYEQSDVAYNAGNYNLWEHKVIPYTNHTGYSSLYDIYILNQPLSGNVIISILDTI